VVGIIESPNRTKSQMCTLTTLNLNGGGKKQKGGKKDKKSKDVENEVVLAMPVNSKLPWMGLDSVPK